jgi:hypothetical protein
MLRYVAVFVILGCACGDDDAETPARPPATTDDPRVTADRASDDDDPLRGLDEPADPSEHVPVPGVDVASPATFDAATPERGCVLLVDEPTRVWPLPGPTTVAAFGDHFVVAGHARREAGGEDLYLVQVSPELPPRPLRTVRLAAPMAEADRRAAPAVAVVDTRTLLVATVDAGGRIMAGRVRVHDADPRLALRQIAQGADTRFGPAAAAFPRHDVIAWTQRGTPMSIHVSTVNEEPAETARDAVTPDRMGGASPAFVAGASPAELMYVDPRAGVSPLVRVPFGADGKPREATVARPIGTAAEPPDVAGARAARYAAAAYTVVGNLATTAVGLLRFDGDNAPAIALVPGSGYGELSVDVAAGERSVVFAASAPLDTPPEAPRVVHVRRAGEHGLDEPLTLVGPDGHADRPAIARRADGTFAVSYESAGAIYVSWLRCAD